MCAYWSMYVNRVNRINMASLYNQVLAAIWDRYECGSDKRVLWAF